MKRIKLILTFIFIIIVFIFAGCEGNSNDQDVNSTDSIVNSVSAESNSSSTICDVNSLNEIRFETGVYKGKNWDEIDEKLKWDGDCVPTKECAIEVAESVIKPFQDKGMFPDYIVHYVFYDEEDEFWVVTFSERIYPKYIDGGYYELTMGSAVNVAIRKSDAKILCLWN